MKRAFVGVAGVVALAVASSATAEPFQFTAELENWSVAGVSEAGQAGSCYASATWTAEGLGSTRFAVVQTAGSDTVSVIVGNTGWGAKDGARYEGVSLHLDNELYGGGDARGTVLEGYKGFGMVVRLKFLSHLANARTLTIRRGGSVVDSLDLKGSSKAVAVLRDCVELVALSTPVTNAPPQLPRDPFAK